MTGVSRRAVLLGALVGGGAVIAGCSGRPDPSRGTPGPAATTAPSVTSRRVDFQGTTYDVPERARRIVTLGDACLQPALDLAVPVVATTAVAPAVVPPSRRAALRALPVVGSGRADDPVTPSDVLEHDPDLVLATEDTDRSLVDELGARLPVVVVRTSGEHRRDWQARVRGLGDVLGSDRAPALRRQYEERTAGIRRDHRDVLASTRVVVLRAWDPTRITAYGPESVIGAIYSDAGVTFVPAVQPSREGRAKATTAAPSTTSPNGAASPSPSALAAPGEFPGTLADVGRYLAGAGVIMLASDYAGGLDAFTGGSLANSDAVRGYVREHDAIMRGAGVLAMTSYAQVDFVLDQLDSALADVTRPR